MQKTTIKSNQINEGSTPEARAKRIRRLRNLANLDRKQMCDDGTINFNTLKSWENAKYGGLPDHAADKIIKRVTREGVICSTDWLLHGKGSLPNLFIQDNKLIENNKSHARKKAYKNEYQNEISQEVNVFRKFYNDISFIQVTDDGMEPLYKKGEYVAGINYYGSHISNLIGKDCIIHLEDERIILRNIRNDLGDGYYNLICLNAFSTISEPVIYNIKIKSAALVIRHYRKIL